MTTKIRYSKNLWDAAKAVLRGKFIAIQAHLRKQDKAQINKLTLHLKQLEREEETRPTLCGGTLPTNRPMPCIEGIDG